ncbi:sce7726 family protein [Listeria seeligeri]|uniref:sce7726 family protein n=1 Tax=Listeria seeligeri TaxID=1640 RepID=UPI001628B62A|nr:sce7726 family protein [Listeria seeligeri]MBC1578305.1 sce7726 family protein [Listeria seeligeri]MBC2219034.1 sce7726 family protein [Listeria seeligeri]MBF2476512.1 sce7726 family protein [Listeria seeligeri]MBM5606127.1 hypothetical protein [Listeria seeligeri]MBM5677592.1 hypothetical protein [Listeria seeligeri]
MTKKRNYFYLAQELYSEYFTHITTSTLENRIIKILGDELDSNFFVKNPVTPREFLNIFLQKNYPNEISIKSNFINKVISKTKKHVTIFELNVGSSRVDLCKVNGQSTAFEIKTELDSPKRLKTQMKDYFSVFEEVYLICPEKKLDTYLKHIPLKCGIYTYKISATGKYFFNLQKKARHSSNICAFSQLSTFTKKDLLSYFSCPNFNEKRMMFNWIVEHHSDKQINTIFKCQLKDKYSQQWHFLLNNKENILEIDYQWFFKNQINPEIVYK